MPSQNKPTNPTNPNQPKQDPSRQGGFGTDRDQSQQRPNKSQ